ncbi:MAG: type II secretion system F family protein [Candidatus Uhrbacteria bacterium]|nr:type II secretion system F family protein [Candidatus Uhrbacteria bacterium]
MPPTKPKEKTAPIKMQKKILEKPVKKPLFLHLKTRDKINFSRHLAVMLDAGIPFHEALGVLKEQLIDPSFRYVLQTALADLADGLPLHTSIAKFPRLFDPFFVNAVSVGEASGTLASTLRYLATQLEKSDSLRGKVRSALLYPVIIFTGALGIGIYLAFFLLPKILPLFTTLNVKLPPTTRALLAVSGWLTAYWPWFVGGLVFAITGLFFLFKIPRMRFAAHALILRLPVAGRLVQNMQTAKFSRILGTLLSSGVTIVVALNVTAESTDNPVYKKELDVIARSVERGETIGDELRRHRRLFSGTTASMIGVGERTGKLSDSLIALAEFTEREVDTTTRDLSTLIEPITLIVVGLLVGFIALSIITPIYQITEGIHA